MCIACYIGEDMRTDDDNTRSVVECTLQARGVDGQCGWRVHVDLLECKHTLCQLHEHNDVRLEVI